MTEWEHIVQHFVLNWILCHRFIPIQNGSKCQEKTEKIPNVWYIRGKNTHTHNEHRYEQSEWKREVREWPKRKRAGTMRLRKKNVISGMCNNFYWTALWMNEHMIIIHKRPVNTSNNWNIESSIVGRTEQLHGAHMHTLSIFVYVCVISTEVHVHITHVPCESIDARKFIQWNP